MQGFEFYRMFKDGMSDEEIAAEIVKRVEGADKFPLEDMVRLVKGMREMLYKKSVPDALHKKTKPMRKRKRASR